jgi:hypothetical protein
MEEQGVDVKIGLGETFNKQDWGGVDLIGLAVVGCCEYGNELTGYTKIRQIS